MNKETPEDLNSVSEQTKSLSAQLDGLLEFIESEILPVDTPPSERPMKAIIYLFKFEKIEVDTKNQTKIDSTNFTENIESPAFRAIYEAVSYWYQCRIGQSAVLSSASRLSGIIMINGVIFQLEMPNHPSEIAEEGETAWWIFEEGLVQGEDPTSWIVNGPDLSSLNETARETVKAEALYISSSMRYINFRNSTNADDSVRSLIGSTINYLQQAAIKMVSYDPSFIGGAWFDLQMANECALKAVIRVNTGKHPHSHDLKYLFEKSTISKEIFDISMLDDWPDFKNISDWRYGLGKSLGIQDTYIAYKKSLNLIVAAMEKVPLSIKPGFRVLLKYKPWSATNAAGKLRN
ncbi:hypothetical protein [Pontivivens nitratireducens]|uniref:hypothetical protein n=1 Tax=Pontivivens nitratireducens TaxID=2758038 RepID=UPI0016399762|nr:hypothetical protein [Pontibrevibacter nitratireducens]